MAEKFQHRVSNQLKKCVFTLNDALNITSHCCHHWPSIEIGQKEKCHENYNEEKPAKASNNFINRRDYSTSLSHPVAL